MLATAQRLFEEEGIDGQIELVKADITALPDALADGDWDGVSCMWTLHQLPEIEVLRGALRQISAVRRKNNAAVWISDFQRLRDPSATESMLQCVDPLSPLILRKDAMASEAAAFTIDELAAELTMAGLEGMSRGHARPLPYLQAFWSEGARSPRSPIATRSPLRGAARREAALLSRGFSAKPF
jgi:hypothetical protein